MRFVPEKEAKDSIIGERKGFSNPKISEKDKKNPEIPANEMENPPISVTEGKSSRRISRGCGIH